MNVKSWKFHGAILFLFAGAVLLVGWLIGYPVPALIIALAMYALWHVINFWRFHHWLQNAEGDPPASIGIWAGLFDKISALVQKNQRQNERDREMLAEFQSLTDSFPDALLILNDRGAISWANKAAMSLLLLRIPEDLGQLVTSFFRGAEFANWYAGWSDAEDELELHSPRSQNTWLKIKAVDLRDQRRLLILRDISNVQNVERMRRDFVANMSHELRTPLTVLLGYLELLEQQPQGKMSEAIKRMQIQGRQMQDMLNDLLELSRLQSDDVPTTDELVDVPAMLGRLRKQAEELSKGKHEIIFDVQDGLCLSGNAPDLESAFHNLLTNAVRYTLRNGTITVKWNEQEEGPRLSVRDTGIGIPKRDINRITERFYRVGSDRARQTGGTGLGLAIVKHALNAHQARLIIESELNSGSEFICIFPAERKRILAA
jgi:two-component system phosphate regulon sensor histidine kinase PhoR